MNFDMSTLRPTKFNLRFSRMFSLQGTFLVITFFFVSSRLSEGFGMADDGT